MLPTDTTNIIRESRTIASSLSEDEIRKDSLNQSFGPLAEANLKILSLLIIGLLSTCVHSEDRKNNYYLGDSQPDYLIYISTKTGDTVTPIRNSTQ